MCAELRKIQAHQFNAPALNCARRASWPRPTRAATFGQVELAAKDLDLHAVKTTAHDALQAVLFGQDAPRAHH